MTRRRQEALRRRFRPTPIRLLFVGESAPASGRFFYQADSGLYRAMRGAFGARDPDFHHECFLASFQQLGCFLVDLSPAPVDHLDRHARREACRLGERTLARRIAQYRPERIATVVRTIESNVARATAKAGWQGEILHLPYPGRWSRSRHAFSGLLAATIDELLLLRG